MADLTAQDIADLRAQGDLVEYLQMLTGRPSKPKPARVAPQQPGYHIPRPGAWPCGTAATGPTPPLCNHDPAA